MFLKYLFLPNIHIVQTIGTRWRMEEDSLESKLKGIRSQIYEKVPMFSVFLGSNFEMSRNDSLDHSENEKWARWNDKPFKFDFRWTMKIFRHYKSTCGYYQCHTNVHLQIYTKTALFNVY